MKKLMDFLIERGLVVNLISVFLLVMGVFAIYSINREAFPNVNLDKIQVNAVYPGASPKEVELLVITPIEQELKSISGIDKMISMSFPGSGRIILDVDPNANNRDQITNDISLAVSRAKLPSDLPTDPIVLEIDGSVFPIIRMAVAAPVNELALKRLGTEIKDDLLNIKGIAQVTILGERKAEIRVTVDPERMAKERISVSDISNSINGWNMNLPGGDIRTPDGQKMVRIVGEFSSAEDAGNLVLRSTASGHTLKLKDVATVTESLNEPSVTYEVSGKPALSMMILKKSEGDIIDTVDQVKDYLATVPSRYGAEVEVETFQDFSRFARIRLGVLTNNGIVGLALVFISLLLFLRFSVAMTTTWGLPIVFLTGLYALYSAGITLNLISMMGFIMVLGMLVDDAIIIGENITYHMEKGLSPNEAAKKGAWELFGPVTATILTTIAAFLPMMFMSGVIGKFIYAIPVVVITLLTLSWLESFLILPSHVAHVTNPNKHPPERKWIVALEHFYVRILRVAIKHRWITVTLSVVILISSFALAKTLPFQLFPAAGVNEYIVRVTAPPGTDLNTMENYLRKINTAMQKQMTMEYVEATLSKAGDVSIDQGDPLTQRGSRYGQIQAIYTQAVTRPQHDALKEMFDLSQTIPAQFPSLDIAFSAIKPGPPVGRALEAEISSYSDKLSESAAQKLIDYLNTIDGVTAIDSGLKAGDDELHVIMDRQLATYAGVNLANASSLIRAASGGLIISSVRHGTEEVDVTIRFPETTKDEYQQLLALQIPNNRGGLIPLQKIAKVESSRGLTTIRHKDGIRIVNVVADIDEKIITSIKLNALVRNNQQTWLGDSFGKVDVGFGGEEEKNKESVISLAIAFIFALVGIFFILAIQFNNLTYPFIVMMAIPFGAIGIILSFYLHSIFWKPMPLSFFAMLGMIALTGVVVNSSLILLVFIQRAIKDGMSSTEAILEAGRRRLRAVLLTATTTIVGLLPTAYGWGGMDTFVSPLALALSWGLLFATIVTLLAIPAMLAVGMDVGNFFRKLRGKPLTS
ncbi:MAG: efflux RND transporter permease subunit [Gammaproteobacteria bacterium]|nr:efflux RND transporter permease subunit [Gammaproteobacteria bacterium]